MVHGERLMGVGECLQMPFTMSDDLFSMIYFPFTGFSTYNSMK